VLFGQFLTHPFIGPRRGVFRVTRRSVLGASFANLSEKERSPLLDLLIRVMGKDLS
jgi:hypothetical protein